MDGCPESTSLARFAWSLAQAASTGLLYVEAPGRRGWLALWDGALRAASCSPDARLLGDWLLLRGELDVAAHASALAHGPAAEPVGAWLERHGVASAEAIARALRDQCRARAEAMLSWPGARFRFEPGAGAIAAPLLAQALELEAIVLDVAAAEGGERLSAWLERHAPGRVACTSFGARLLREQALFDADEALAQRLSAGISARQLQTLCDNGERERTRVGALWWLGGLRPAHAPAYALLLRKHNQLRRRASARELLDLERSSPLVAASDPRRALRRLALQVHPDCLGPGAPAALRALSGDVMRALLQAESELSRGSHAARRPAP